MMPPYARTPGAGFLVRRGGMYLEFIPFTRTFEYIAMGPKHASVFTEAHAAMLAAEHSGDVLPDAYYQRPPEDHIPQPAVLATGAA